MLADQEYITPFIRITFASIDLLSGVIFAYAASENATGNDGRVYEEDSVGDH